MENKNTPGQPSLQVNDSTPTTSPPNQPNNQVLPSAPEQPPEHTASMPNQYADTALPKPRQASHSFENSFDTRSKKKWIAPVVIMLATVLLLAGAFVYWNFFYVSKKDYAHTLGIARVSQKALQATANPVIDLSEEDQGDISAIKAIKGSIADKQAKLDTFNATVTPIANTEAMRDAVVAKAYSAYRDKVTLQYQEYSTYYNDLEKFTAGYYGCYEDNANTDIYAEENTLAKIFSACKQRLDNVKGLKNEEVIALNDAAKDYVGKLSSILSESDANILSSSEQTDKVYDEFTKSGEKYTSALENLKKSSTKKLDAARADQQLKKLMDLLEQKAR